MWNRISVDEKRRREETKFTVPRVLDIDYSCLELLFLILLSHEISLILTLFHGLHERFYV